VADEAVLLDPSYGDPLPDEAPAILCTKDERFKPSSRDKVSFFLCSFQSPFVLSLLMF
jgi:hypothetical protein